MKNIIISILALIIIWFFTLKIWNIDNIDRTHPFGTKKYLNIKHAPKLYGEEFGVNVYKGIAKKKDSVPIILEKTRFLGSCYSNDVVWRRCIFFSVIFSTIFLIINGLENCGIKLIITIILCMYMCVYMLKQWENAHVNKIKSNHIDRNIKLLSKKISIHN